MKFKLLQPLVLLIFATAYVNTQAAYNKYIVTQTPLEYPSNNWTATDDDTILVNLGFTFPFGSAGNFTQLYINSNGGLANSSWTTYSNQSLPRSSPTVIIAPYWDDIYRRNGTIKYGTFGTAPNRHFVAAWTDTPRYSNNGKCTFQVVLYENGDIRFRYSTSSVSCDGGSGNGSATVGIQESSSVYIQHSYNVSIDLTKDILFTSPTAKIYLSKSSYVISDPVNGTTNPKAIPGAIIEYILQAKNEGGGIADNNSIQLTDAIPNNTALYVNDISGAGTGPIRFIDGSPSSGLSYNFNSLSSTTDHLSFSNNNGINYNYVPSADADGVDSNVTNVKMNTSGEFSAKTGTTAPNFQFLFRVRVQ